MPRLAKQRVDYMIHAMKEFRDNKRSGADTCPYRKSNPYVLMVQPSKNGPHLDAPGALNEPS
jgi:hypothetical protein